MVCGNTKLFNALILGLVEQQSPPQGKEGADSKTAKETGNG
jgi:hypothetical protein